MSIIWKFVIFLIANMKDYALSGITTEKRAVIMIIYSVLTKPQRN